MSSASRPDVYADFWGRGALNANRAKAFEWHVVKQSRSADSADQKINVAVKSILQFTLQLGLLQ